MKTLSLCLLLALIAGPAARAVADESLAGRIVDLTHAYDADAVYWPTADGFELTIDFKGMTDGGLSLIHISEPTRQESRSRMPSSA